MRTQDDGLRHASECWSSGFNCAESVLRGVCYGMDVDLPDRALMMATPFGGGVGRSEDLCGALVGGVLAIGAIKGRTDAGQDRLASYEVAARLYKRFHEKLGSTSCKVLNRSDFKSSEHRVRCGRFVAEATSLALQSLKE